jgi:hypothetical protein
LDVLEGTVFSSHLRKFSSLLPNTKNWPCAERGRVRESERVQRVRRWGREHVRVLSEFAPS